MNDFLSFKQKLKPIADRYRLGSWAEFSCFAALLFGFKLWLISTNGNATPFWDQWNGEAALLYQPFYDGTLGWSDLFATHNEHFILTSRLFALVLIQLNGIWNPLLQMVVNAILHVITLVFLISLLTKVIGRYNSPSLLLFSLIIFGIPYAWQNTLWGFQSGFYFVQLFSVACLWLTITSPPLSSRWWGGVACAALAFLSLASGLFALASGAIIGFILYVTGLRKTGQQLLSIMILFGLFTIGIVLTPTVDYHATLKAASVHQFSAALIAALSWPLNSSLFSAIARNLPALVFVGILLWRRPPANDRRWFLFALVIWVSGQAASISYGRATDSLASRYLDLYAIGILVNFTCLLSISQGRNFKRTGWIITGVSIWLIIVLLSLWLYAAKTIPAELVAIRNAGTAQEINTRNYLATGDFGHLKDKPVFHVPYPNPEHLASILALPHIQAILPPNIRPPLTPKLIESKPADAFVANGFYFTTPKRTGLTLGSYGAQGDQSTGHATIQFDTEKRGGLIAIPVAGYPLEGNKIEIEQNGTIRELSVDKNPQESWTMSYTQVDTGEFTIHLTDANTTNWLAIGNPVYVGRLDSLTGRLLANYHLVILIGLMLMLLRLTKSNLIYRETNESQ